MPVNTFETSIKVVAKGGFRTFAAGAKQYQQISQSGRSFRLHG